MEPYLWRNFCCRKCNTEGFRSGDGGKSVIRHSHHSPSLFVSLGFDRSLQCIDGLVHWVTPTWLMSLYPRKRTLVERVGMSALCLFSAAASAQTYGAPYGKGKAPPPPVVTKG